MRDASQDRRVSLFGRRNFLRTASAATASLAMAGTASAYHGNYDTVVDVVEEGADDTGEEPINPVLEDLREDSILVEFPDGEYKMDRQFRFTGFDDYGLVAKGDGATIRPVPAGDWNGDGRRLFKLGTHYEPGGRLRVDGLTFDYTAPDTGLRAIQAQADDPLVRKVTVAGRHDTGNWGPGPLLVDVTDPQGTGRVERVNLRGGGNMAPRSDSGMIGPIGFNVSRYHEGTLRVVDCRIDRFPNNGFYCSSERGRTIVERGVFANCNVANIRLAGQRSEVRGSKVRVDWSPDEDWHGQVGIRLDGGSGYTIRDVQLDMPRPTGNAIRVMSDVGATRIENVSIVMGEPKEDAIYVVDDAGPVEVVDCDVEKGGPGQAIEIRPSGPPVVVENLTVDGDASGGDGGRHAVRCARANCEFRGLSVDQPGEEYRRCLTLVGDDCTVSGGTFRSTHHPIVVDSSGATVKNVEAEAYDESEGIKVSDGHGDIEVVDSTVWNGIENRGSDVHTSGNEYPES